MLFFYLQPPDKSVRQFRNSTRDRGQQLPRNGSTDALVRPTLDRTRLPPRRLAKETSSQTKQPHLNTDSIL